MCHTVYACSIHSVHTQRVCMRTLLLCVDALSELRASCCYRVCSCFLFLPFDSRIAARVDVVVAVALYLRACAFAHRRKSRDTIMPRDSHRVAGHRCRAVPSGCRCRCRSLGRCDRSDRSDLGRIGRGEHRTRLGRNDRSCRESQGR